MTRFPKRHSPAYEPTLLLGNGRGTLEPVRSHACFAICEQKHGSTSAAVARDEKERSAASLPHSG